MRRTAWVATLFASFCFAAFGQRGGGFGGHDGSGHAGSGGMTYSPRSAPAGRSVAPATVGVPAYIPNTYGSRSGFGNVVFPGTGHAPGTFSPFSIVQPGFAAGLQNSVSGFGFNNHFGVRRFGRNNNAVVIPYGVPIYVPYGGGYYSEPYPGQYDQPMEGPAPYSDGYMEPQSPSVIYVVPSGPAPQQTAPQQPQGPVIYNVPPHEDDSGYVEVTPATPAAKPVYLIALKNASIYSATDYWVEGDTLHYLTTSGAHNQISLNEVDLDFTMKLNRERGVDFRLQK